MLHNAYEAPDCSQAVVLPNWTCNEQRVTLTWKNESSTIDLKPREARCEVQPKGAPGSRAATPSGATEPAHGTDVLVE